MRTTPDPLLNDRWAAVIAGSLAGLMKASGNTVAAATPGTDFVIPTGAGSALTVQPAGATASGTIAARFGRYHDVKNDYGATGDGTADDTAAIAAAVTAAGVGGTIYFPPGTYTTTQAILPLEGQTLIGQGWAITKIKATAAMGTFIYLLNVPHVTASGLYIDGSGLTTGAGIGQEGSPYGSFRGIRFVGVPWGFECSTSPWSTFAKCIVEDATSNGIEIRASDHFLIDGCISTVSGSNAIEIYTVGTTPIRGGRIIGCYLSSEHANGIGCYGVDGISIIGNRVEDNGRNPGIWLGDAEFDATVHSMNATVMGNTIRNCGTIVPAFGIYLSATIGCVVQGNIVDACTINGILVTEGSHNQVRGNVVSNSQRSGILVNASNSAIIEGNTCHDNSQRGDGNDHGIEITGSDSLLVVGNRCGDVSAVHQRFGIFQSGATNSLFANNNLLNNQYGFNGNGGAGNQWRNNVGFPDQNAGQVTITTGNTSIVVNCNLGINGLALVPAGGDIMIAAAGTSGLGAATRAWISAVDGISGTFTISIDQDPGADGATLAWKISIFGGGA